MTTEKLLAYNFQTKEKKVIVTKPDNFCLNGPRYKDQIYTRYLNAENPDERSWDEAIAVSEHAHNERIRNVISPLSNLVMFLEHRNDNDVRKMEPVIMSDANIKLYRNCIDKLLVIPEL